jgi:hypothetical protein
VQLFEAEMHASPLMAMFSGGIDGLDVLGGGNEWTYWSRSDAHTTVLNFGGDPRRARAGDGRSRRSWPICWGLAVSVTPHTRVEDVDLRWYVGLDPAGTAIGNALWRGEAPPATLVGLFRLEFDDPRAGSGRHGRPSGLA